MKLLFKRSKLLLRKYADAEDNTFRTLNIYIYIYIYIYTYMYVYVIRIDIIYHYLSHIIIY